MAEIIQFARIKEPLPLIELINTDLKELLRAYERVEKTNKTIMINDNIEINKDNLEDLHNIIIKKSFAEGHM